MTIEERKVYNKAYWHRRYTENRTAWLARSKQNRKIRHKKFREIINRAKTKPCMDCGVQYNPWVMEFDHRKPEEKKFSIGSGSHWYSMKNLENEIAKCVVVCANCHKERTYRQNQGPWRINNAGTKRIAGTVSRAFGARF